MVYRKDSAISKEFLAYCNKKSPLKVFMYLMVLYSTAPDNPEQNGNNCYYKKYMNNATSMHTEVTKCPNDYQYNGDYVK
jgi:hypothetical protein